MLDETKRDIADKDREFSSLVFSGEKMLRTLDSEEKVMLEKRLGEVSARWKDLQNKMLNLGNSLERSSLKAPAIHADLRDHQDWVHRKKRELASLSLGGDVTSLNKQMEEHSAFK